MFADELIEGNVAVETIDDIVTITPRVWIAEVRLFTTGFCKSGHIEPVTSPAFAKSLGGKESVDRGLDRLLLIFGTKLDECLNILWRWWQSCEIEVQATNENFRRCVTIAFDSAFLMPNCDESINFGRCPVLISYRGNHRERRLFVGPMICRLCLFCWKALRLAFRFARVDRSGIDPKNKVIDLFVSQFFLGRHLQAIGMFDGCNQETLGRVARYDGLS